MQNFLSLGYILHVLLAVSANFSDNPSKYMYITLVKIVKCGMGNDLPTFFPFWLII